MTVGPYHRWLAVHACARWNSQIELSIIKGALNILPSSLHSEDQLSMAALRPDLISTTPQEDQASRVRAVASLESNSPLKEVKADLKHSEAKN